MKKLFYLPTNVFLTCALVLLSLVNAAGQSQQAPASPKDSLAKTVLYSTSATNTMMAQPLVEKSTSLWSDPSNEYHLQTQSALTGPGKVVTCVMILSCLFFYFNRKK
ncbi:MAG: hypothetical protein Sapg2KO_15690 [Saprospiraceae bacterium]